MKNYGRKRHIAKTFTWRIIGSLDTIILSWIISGDLKIGFAIGGAEVFTKMILYYFHERIWFNTRIFITQTSHIRHLIKTITWRLVGTIDTMFMGWIISGDPTIGLKIGALELITKMALYYLHERLWHRTDFGLTEVIEENDQEKSSVSEHLFKQNYEIDRSSRNEAFGHNSFMVLLTGLSGSGKSTIANLVEKELSQQGYKTYLLDGDNVRLGLNKDLSFSEEDREENLRRIAEVSKLFVDSGTIVLAAFVSPLRKDREMMREIIGEDFMEVFIDTPLEICEQRDVKGLYQKARNGEIPNFTGISAPYEQPLNPEISIKTVNSTPEFCAVQLMEQIMPKIQLKK